MARLVQANDPLRGRALESLFASQAPSALGLLVQVAISGDDVRARLPERVKLLGYMAVAPLIEVLRRADDPVRDLVVDLLQVPDDPRALIIMAKGLEEDDPRIAEVVVRALVARGGAALPYLRHLLEHPDPAVRQRAERVVRASDPAVEEVS
jgi:HEAT repeat protein